MTAPLHLRALIILGRRHAAELETIVARLETGHTYRDHAAEAAHVAYLTDLAARVGPL